MRGVLLIVVLFSATAGVAQKTDDPDSLPAKTFELTVKTIPPDSLRLPFQSIRIIDSRFDTSKLGYRISRHPDLEVGWRYNLKLGEKIFFKKILLAAGVKTSIENFYNEYYKHNFSSNEKVLVISIKKLWINNVPNRKGEPERNFLYSLSQSDIYAKFEYYLSSVNGYVPLKRIDTIFQITADKKTEGYEPKDENELPFLCFAHEKMIENVNYSFYVKDLDKRKEMSIEEIEKYNAESKKIPILYEPIKKGVFLTFEEFKYNKPSVTSFSKRKIPNKRIYEGVDDKNNVILDYFAYYDGTKLAIAKHLASLFGAGHLANLAEKNISQDNYGIYKVNDSFQFFENYSQYQAPEDINTPSYILIKVPRQIDLETGEVY